MIEPYKSKDETLESKLKDMDDPVHGAVLKVVDRASAYLDQIAKRTASADDNLLCPRCSLQDIDMLEEDISNVRYYTTLLAQIESGDAWYSEETKTWETP